MRRGFVDQFNYLSSPLQSMGFNPTHFTTVPVKAAECCQKHRGIQSFDHLAAQQVNGIIKQRTKQVTYVPYRHAVRFSGSPPYREADKS